MNSFPPLKPKGPVTLKTQDHFQENKVTRTHKKVVIVALEILYFFMLTFEVSIKDVAGDTLNRVVKRENVNALPILHVRTLVHRNNIPETHTQICSNNLVHPNLWLITSLICKNNTDGVLSFLALQIVKTISLYQFPHNKTSKDAFKSRPMDIQFLCAGILFNFEWRTFPNS